MENKFTEDDKNKVIEFLNMVAEYAKFNLDTKEVIQYFGLLSYMQKTLLKKIDSNILEIKKVVEAEEEQSQDSQSE